MSLKLGFADADYGYALDLGLPVRSASMFLRDPAIKAEAVWTGARLGRSNAFARRDGADWAAALQTVREIGDARALDEAVDDAFPGSAVAVTDRNGLFDIEMRQPGLLRPLAPAELSEGTLRYLLLVVALLSPRPPPLTVLNEPEASLTPT